MKTKYYSNAKWTEKDLVSLSEMLAKGEVIGFPTETVYGIGADIYNKVAAQKIFTLKNRSEKMPLSAHIGSLEQITEIAVNIPALFYKLAERFLPGPLAIILQRHNSISNTVTGDLDTIGIRFPDCEQITELINFYGKPLAATSANLSGLVSAFNAEMVKRYFDGKIPAVIDAGTTKFGIESTVISLANNKPAIIREGIISRTEIEEFLSMKLIIF